MTSCCIFGDSIASGIVFDNCEERYFILKNWLHRSKALGLSIINFARFGCTITKGGEIIDKHLHELNKYDYVALEFGGNDCDFNWQSISAMPGDNHHAKTPIKQFVSKYSKIIEIIKQYGGKPVLVNLPPIDSKKYFSRISKGLNAENILSWLGTKDTIYTWHEQYNSAVNALSERYSIPLIDIRRDFIKAPDWSEYMCSDGIHPNPAGYALIESAIIKRLRSILKPRLT